MATEKLRYIVTANTRGFTSAMKAAGAIAVTAFAAAIKITADFNKELSKLRGISGATGNDLARLEGQSRKLGATTAFTATQAIQLQVELAKLGFTTREILNSSGGVLDLAAGLGAGLSEAATLTGGTLRAFGLDTKETTRVVDVLSKAATSSGLDFEKFRESLKHVAPVAAQLGYSLEETIALLGTLADSNISGSQAGTNLRQIMLELEKAGISLAESFTQTDFALNANVASLDLVKKRALPAFLVLKNGGADVEELRKKLLDSEGAANKLRTAIEDNAWGDWKKLMSVLSDTALSLGKSVDGPLRSALQGITKWIQEGGLLRVLDSLHLGFLNMAIGVFEFGRAIDFVALAISKGPFGNSDLLGNSSILARITAATKALEEFRKKKNEIKNGGGFEGTGGGGPVPDEPEGTKIDLTEVVVGAPKLTEFEKFQRRFVRLFKQTTATADLFTDFFNEWAASGIANVFRDTFAAMGQAIGEGTNILKAAGNAVLNVVGGLLKSLGDFILDLALEAVKLGTITTIFAKAIAAIKKWIIANPVAAIAGGLALIAIGTAFGAAASNSQASIGGGAGGSSTPTSTSVSSPNVRSLQGSDRQSRNVGGYTTRDGDIIQSKAIRQSVQASDRKYRSLYG